MIWQWTSMMMCGGCSRNQVQQHLKTIITLPANLLPQHQEVDVTDLLQHYFGGMAYTTHTCSKTLESGKQCEGMAFRVNKLEEQGQVLVIEVQKVEGYRVTSKLKMALNGHHYHLLGVAYYHQYEGGSGHFSAVVSRCGSYWYVDGLKPTTTTRMDSWTNAVQVTATHTYDRFGPTSSTTHTNLVVYGQVEV